MSFLPSELVKLGPADGKTLYDNIDSAITDAETLIDYTDSMIVGDIGAQVKDSESVVSEISSVILGDIGIQVDKAEQLIAKTYDKLINSADSLLTEAYSYMSLVGLPIPTDKDVAVWKGSGEVFDVELPNTPQGSMPGGWGPCSGGGYPDPTTGECEPAVDCGPRTGMAWVTDPVTFQNVLTPITCPAGSFADPLLGCVPCPGGGDTMPGNNPAGEDCTQYIVAFGIYSGQDTEYQYDPSATPVNRPIIYTGPGSKPDGDYELVSFIYIDMSAGGATEAKVWVHRGFYLYVDKNTGVVFESAIQLNSQQLCGIDATPGAPTGDTLPGNDGGVCKPIAVPSCDPVEDLDFGTKSEDEDFCSSLKEFIKATAEQSATFFGMLGTPQTAGQLDGTAAMIAKAITGTDTPIVATLMKSVVGWMEKVNKSASNATRCGSPNMLAMSVTRAVMELIQSYLHILPPQLLTYTQQAHNTICQSIIPSSGQADGAFLADSATKEDWECWHKANGDLIPEAEKVLQAGRTRPNAAQAVELYRKDYISQEQYNTYTRQAGVLNETDKQAIWDLSKQWESPSDLIRMMKRDVFDQEAIRKGKLDEDFELKYTDETESIGTAIGVTKERMLREWMAHWQLPSYTMGREMLYRFNDPNLPENLRFTTTEFREMLKIDDWAPGYVDRMIEMAFHPVTAGDAVKAFMIYTQSEDELKKQYMKVGYSDETSDFMVKYQKKRRDVATRKAAGFPTLRTAANMYAKCEIPESEFVELVDKITLAPEQAAMVVDAANMARSIRERREAIRTVKRPFILGIYDDADVANELSEYDVDPSCVDGMIKNWKRERLRKDKLFTASQLCDMREKGIIDAATQLNALVRIGWDFDDATLVMKQCEANISERQRKKAERLAMQAARQAEKTLKEIAKRKRLEECGPPPCPKRPNSNTQTSSNGQSKAAPK